MAASARVKCDGIPGGRFFNQIYGIPGVWYLEFQVAVFNPICRIPGVWYLEFQVAVFLSWIFAPIWKVTFQLGLRPSQTPTFHLCDNDHFLQRTWHTQVITLFSRVTVSPKV